MSPDQIECTTPPDHLISVFFGYISGLPDPEFLRYSLRHREHPQVRRVFLSEIQKRSALPNDIVDEVTEALLTAIETSAKHRAKNETLLRYLIPHLSTQMRTRVFRTMMKSGTRTTRNKLLRKTKPEDAPGIENDVLQIAIDQKNEHALVGIVYRWPLSLWQHHAERLYQAAQDLPWLQRQIIFRSEMIDTFLDKRLIEDPVTELYVRSRFARPVSQELIDAAIERACTRPDSPFDFADRLGLVAWCLGRLGVFDCLSKLPAHRPVHESYLADPPTK